MNKNIIPKSQIEWVDEEWTDEELAQTIEDITRYLERAAKERVFRNCSNEPFPNKFKHPKTNFDENILNELFAELTENLNNRN